MQENVCLKISFNRSNVIKDPNFYVNVLPLSFLVFKIYKKILNTKNESEKTLKQKVKFLISLSNPSKLFPLYY